MRLVLLISFAAAGIEFFYAPLFLLLLLSLSLSLLLVFLFCLLPSLLCRVLLSVNILSLKCCCQAKAEGEGTNGRVKHNEILGPHGVYAKRLASNCQWIQWVSK